MRMEVLLLNNTYEPLQVLSLKKAIKLLVKNRADIIKSSGDRILRSCNESMPVPSVIKLRQYIKYNKKPIPYSKKNVLIRDKYTCQYCNTKESRMTIDHIISQSKGGDNTWENTVACCIKCNTTKADKSLIKSGLTLLKIPKTPGPFTFMKHLIKHDEWEEFFYL